MQAVAKGRYQRISTRKARVCCKLVRGKNVAIAVDELRFTRKAAAPIVLKVLTSAIANARQKKQNVNLDKLVVHECYADMAPNSHLRRWRPRAQGRATMVKKGNSHITVILSDGEEN